MKMYEKKCNKVYFQGEKLWQKWKNFSNYLKNLVDKSSNSFTKRRGNKSWLKALFPKLHCSMVHHLVIHYLIHVITLSILNWLRILLKVHFWAIFWIEFTFISFIVLRELVRNTSTTWLPEIIVPEKQTKSAKSWENQLNFGLFFRKYYFRFNSLFSQEFRLNF